MEAEISLAYSEQSITDSYTEPDKSSPQPLIRLFKDPF
jgi:hypothetical protein